MTGFADLLASPPAISKLTNIKNAGVDKAIALNRLRQSGLSGHAGLDSITGAK